MCIRDRYIYRPGEFTYTGTNISVKNDIPNPIKGDSDDSLLVRISCVATKVGTGAAKPRITVKSGSSNVHTNYNIVSSKTKTRISTGLYIGANSDTFEVIFHENSTVHKDITYSEIEISIEKPHTAGITVIEVDRLAENAYFGRTPNNNDELAVHRIWNILTDIQRGWENVIDFFYLKDSTDARKVETLSISRVLENYDVQFFCGVYESGAFESAAPISSQYNQYASGGWSQIIDGADLTLVSPSQDYTDFGTEKGWRRLMFYINSALGALTVQPGWNTGSKDFGDDGGTVKFVLRAKSSSGSGADELHSIVVEDPDITRTCHIKMRMRLKRY